MTAIVSNIYYNLTVWGSGVSITAGARVSSNGQAWQATNSATTGPTAPSGTSNVSDGAVTWKWLSAIDYASLAAWASAIGTSSTQSNGSAVSTGSGNVLSTPCEAWLWNTGEIAGGGSPWLDITPTTTATNYVKIRCAPGESFRDNPNAGTNALFYNPVNGVAFSAGTGGYQGLFQSSTGYCYFEGLQFKIQGSGAYSAAIFANTSVVPIANCLFYRTGNAPFCTSRKNGGGSALTNCLFIDGSAASGTSELIAHENNQAGANIKNCTLVAINSQNCAAIALQFPDGLTISNTIIVGYAAAFSGATGPGSYTYFNTQNNLLSVASYTAGSGNAPYSESGSLFSRTAASLFVNPSSDFRLKGGSPAIDAGYTDSTVTTDILGTTRPQGSAYDIGAYEYPVSSGSYTASLTDTAASSDAASGTMAASGTVSASASSSDTVTATMAARASVIDTAASSDALTGAMTSAATTIDSASTSDSPTATMAAAATLADTAASSDSPTATATFAPVSLGDSATTSDSLTPLAALFAMLADSVITTDAVTPTGQSASATLADTATSADSLSGLAALFASLSDTAASSDAGSGTMAATSAPADTAATSDAFTVPGGFAATLSDTVVTSDALIGSMAAALALADTVIGVSSFTATAAGVASLSDSAAAGDSLTGLAAFAWSLSDAITGSDGLMLPGGAYTGALSDAAAAADSLTGTAAFTWSLGDVAATSDVWTVIGGFTPAPQRTITSSTSGRTIIGPAFNRGIGSSP